MDGRLFNASLRKFGTGFWNVPNSRIVLVSLGLLNAVLFIIAVVLGVMCAGVREDSSLKDSHSAALKLIGELTDLRSNHSDLIEAEEETKRLLQMKIQDHVKLKKQIQQQMAINDNYQTQFQALQTEKENLQANITALEQTCGRCLHTWSLRDSSCYFFSYTESPVEKKSWHDSRTDCISRGADLIVIESSDEQKFVSNRYRQLMGNKNSWEDGFWIGLIDTHAEGTFVWVNNVTELEPRYWMNGEPNNYRDQEDCVTTVNSGRNPWKTRNDLNCEEERHWICEKKSD
ncbi:C-type lectin domain family 4 member M [Oryzias melastigma]|uniref:C-type lectin domain family 4 member M n=1 Tax=Oryzias melastigma TaxID=30732 RepID=A0A834BWT2_ORYME|nr:C-type lectin domain family 4 member M [Oryzias melastigma]